MQITFSHVPPDQAATSFDPGADTTPIAALLAAAGLPDASVVPS